MEGNKKGLWTITIPLKPGRYLYQFNVNGVYWKPTRATRTGSLTTSPSFPVNGHGLRQ